MRWERAMPWGDSLLSCRRRDSRLRAARNGGQAGLGARLRTSGFGPCVDCAHVQPAARRTPFVMHAEMWSRRADRRSGSLDVRP